MNGFKFEKVPECVRVTNDAKGTYAASVVGQVGHVVHADADSTMILIGFDNGFRLWVEEKYLDVE